MKTSSEFGRSTPQSRIDDLLHVEAMKYYRIIDIRRILVYIRKDGLQRKRVNCDRGCFDRVHNIWFSDFSINIDAFLIIYLKSSCSTAANSKFSEES